MWDLVWGLYASRSLRYQIVALSKSFAQIDSYFQGISTTPSLHVIIEPHPDVLESMRNAGWFEKPGVKVLQGKWQDFVGTDQMAEFGGFDVIYTDTFSEDYNGWKPSHHHLICTECPSELYKFFKCVPKLLAGPQARFSFFNGLGATSECSALLVSITAEAMPRHDRQMQFSTMYTQNLRTLISQILA